MKTSLMMMVIPWKPKWFKLHSKLFGSKLVTLNSNHYPSDRYIGLVGTPQPDDRRSVVYYLNELGSKRVGHIYSDGSYRAYIWGYLGDSDYELLDGTWEEYKYVETIEINKRAKWQHSLDTSLARAAAAGIILGDILTVVGGVLVVILGLILMALLSYHIWFDLMM